MIVYTYLYSQPLIDAVTAFIKTHNDRRTLSHRAVIGRLIQLGREQAFVTRQPNPHPWEDYAKAGDKCRLVTAWDTNLEGSDSLVGVGGFAIDRDGNARRSFTIVRTDFRRRGIGTRILAKKVELARAAGVRRFRVEVGMTNEPSVKLVEKVGFEEYGIGERNGHAVILYEYNQNSVQAAAHSLSALFG